MSKRPVTPSKQGVINFQMKFYLCSYDCYIDYIDSLDNERYGVKVTVEEIQIEDVKR